MLIRNADIYGFGPGDVRLSDGIIAQTGRIDPQPGEPCLDARGGALLPGLHDHHIHLAALSARQASVACGPPAVHDADGLATALAHASGEGWLRGIGYHESVAGMLDRAMLDAIAPGRPVRIQHRSGRMWFLNSIALDRLLDSGAAPPAGLDRASGRLFDADPWLRAALGSAPPGFGAISAELARSGITGITDMSPANDPAMAGHFAAEQSARRLLQTCLLAGTLGLAESNDGAEPNDGAGLDDGIRLAIGPAKLHLHEADLPDYDAAIAFIAAAHAQGRNVAIHCVTETELVFALAALADAGARTGDRIEHASVAPDSLIDQIADLGLQVVSQPHFIAERGDRYRQDVAADAVPLLYRLRAFLTRGVTLAGGSDAPFGSVDPWAAMRAAGSRCTMQGRCIGPDEALSPEQALALFLADPVRLERQRRVVPGAPADLCLLDRPWQAARERLSADDVRATFIAGVRVHDRIDQAP